MIATLVTAAVLLAVWLAVDWAGKRADEWLWRQLTPRRRHSSYLGDNDAR